MPQRGLHTHVRAGPARHGRAIHAPPRCRASAGPATGTGKEVVVVGGGVAGLATAGRLARAGLAVTLLEKNGEVGGRLQSAELGGARFDTGPSLLLFPDKYREAFEGLGSSLEAHVDVRRVGPAAYRVWFAGGGDPSALDLLNDEGAMAAQLEGVERGAGAAYLRFLALARQQLALGMPNFIERDLSRLEDAKGLADLLPSLASINVLDLLGQHDWRLKQFFKNPRLRALFSFQDLYVGLSPYTAPAVFGLLAGTELSDGVWYPLGGFQRVRDGLLAAARACGVEVRTGAEVVAISTDAASGAATGAVLASGERLSADVVVCNRDLPAAYSLLEGGEAGIGEYARRRTQQLSGLKYSAGVIAFNWALSRPVEGLRHHNVFLSEQLRESWELAASPAALLAHPNFYVHCPSRTDPTAAPPGGDSVMALLPVASMQQHQGDYSELVAAGRQRILDTFSAAGLGDVGPAITHEIVIDPPEWRARYGVQHGAAFGLAHGLDQLSIFRPANKDGRVAGLYFVGASTRPGNGVPLCLIGAKLTADRILEDVGIAAPAAA